MPLTNAGREALDALPLLQEFFTEEEAKTHVICPNTLALEQPRMCLGHVCGAWRWKPEGVTYERGEPIGFCGTGGRPR